MLLLLDSSAVYDVRQCDESSLFHEAYVLLQVCIKLRGTVPRDALSLSFATTVSRSMQHIHSVVHLSQTHTHEGRKSWLIWKKEPSFKLLVTIFHTQDV